jgi:hypothetical protein
MLWQVWGQIACRCSSRSTHGTCDQVRRKSWTFEDCSVVHEVFVRVTLRPIFTPLAEKTMILHLWVGPLWILGNCCVVKNFLYIFNRKVHAFEITNLYPLFILKWILPASSVIKGTSVHNISLTSAPWPQLLLLKYKKKSLLHDKE